MSAASEAAAEVIGLRVRLAGRGARVVDDVSFTVGAGELLGLVGESGSGKTTVALSLLGYVRRGLEFESGQVLTGGTDMLAASEKRLRRLRGAEVAYVPQDPASALSPGLKIRTQLIEGMRAHPDALAAKALGSPEARLAEILDEAGLGEIPHLLDAYPHELSGGQQQRVALAMAFALRPQLIVLDEPTTGLDVSTQQRVLATVQSLCRSYGVAAVYVSHDLAVVGGLVDSLLVLYAGRMMETGRTASVFGAPAHPYTRRLLQAIPSPERAAVLEGIAGRRRRRAGASQDACSPPAASWRSRPAPPVRSRRSDCPATTWSAACSPSSRSRPDPPRRPRRWRCPTHPRARC